MNFENLLELYHPISRSEENLIIFLYTGVFSVPTDLE